MVVVVKTLSEREHPEQPGVASFLAGAVDPVASIAVGVGDVADEPVSQHAGGVPGAEEDDDRGPSRHETGCHHEQQHLGEPPPVQKSEPAVLEIFGGDPEAFPVGGNVAKVEKAMVVHQYPVLISQVAGGIGLVLPVIANVVQAKPGEGASESGHREEPGEKIAQPAGTPEAAVDDAAVQAGGMAEADRQEGERGRDRRPIPAKGPPSECDRRKKVGVEPDGLDGCEGDVSGGTGREGGSWWWPHVYRVDES